MNKRRVTEGVEDFKKQKRKKEKRHLLYLRTYIEKQLRD